MKKFWKDRVESLEEWKSVLRDRIGLVKQELADGLENLAEKHRTELVALESKNRAQTAQLDAQSYRVETCSSRLQKLEKRIEQLECPHRAVHFAEETPHRSAKGGGYTRKTCPDCGKDFGFVSVDAAAQELSDRFGITFSSPPTEE